MIKNRFLLCSALLLVLVAVTTGCSNRGTVSGGQALATKPGPVINDESPPVRPDMFGETPITESETFKQYGLCQRIHFDYDKSAIKPEFTECLDKIANALIQETEYLLIVEGHCDERGSDSYNIALGERRASSTKDYLTQRGLTANRIQIRSMGESMPLAPCSNETCWKQNRRADFYVVRTAR